MVKKPVAKKEKKKSARQLQVELNKKRLEAFNSAVAEVRDIFAKVKYEKTKPPRIVYLKRQNDNKRNNWWRRNGTQRKDSMSIIFRTNAQRDLVLKHLKEINKVAYLRFASVYKEFSDASDFEKEVAEL